jgi:hypothetical protein
VGASTPVSATITNSRILGQNISHIASGGSSGAFDESGLIGTLDNSTPDITWDVSASTKLLGYAAIRKGSAPAGQDYVIDLFDTITIAETEETSVGHVRSATDALTIAEAEALSVGVVKSISEALSIAEELLTKATYEQSLLDSIAIAESDTVDFTFVRNLIDSILITEVDLFKSQIIRDAIDSIAIDEQAVFGGGQQLLFEESIAISETITPSLGAILDLAEVVLITEVLSVGFGIFHKDSVSVSEDRTVSLGNIRLFSDALSVIEVDDEVLGAVLNLQDSLLISEVVDEIQGFVRGFEDALSILEVDSVEETGAFILNFVDLIGITETIATPFDYKIDAQDDIAVAETVVTPTNYIRSFQSLIDIVEDLDRTLDVVRAFGESISILEPLIEDIVGHVRSDLSEIVIRPSLSKDLKKTVSSEISILERFSKGESLQLNFSIPIFIDESAPLIQKHELFAVDDLLVTESDLVSLSAIVNAFELISIVEDSTATAGFLFEFMEAIGVAETIVRDFGKNPSDSISIVETEEVIETEPADNFIVDETDSITITEGFSISLGQKLSATDSIAITESPDVIPGIAYKVSDISIIEIEELLEETKQGHVRNPTDLIEIEELGSRIKFQDRKFFEVISLAEKVELLFVPTDATKVSIVGMPSSKSLMGQAVTTADDMKTSSQELRGEA